MSELYTVLVVEDDKMVRQLLKDTLEADNFIVLDTDKPERALDILDQYNADIIILDLNLGHQSGLDFIRIMKNKAKAPLIILSGVSEEQYKIKSLELGADEFIEKPFSPALFKARIIANLRRAKGKDESRNNNGFNDNTQRVSFCSWQLDRKKMQLYDEQRRSVNLTSKEFKVLDYMVVHAGEVVSRDDLRTALMKEGYQPSNRAIDIKISRIRKKIEDTPNSPNILKTIHGAGYMFNEETIEKNSL